MTNLESFVVGVLIGMLTICVVLFGGAWVAERKDDKKRHKEQKNRKRPARPYCAKWYS